MENNDILWQTKLAARMHDPAEKALVLLHDPTGHEGGTSQALSRLLLAIGAEPLPDTTKHCPTCCSSRGSKKPSTAMCSALIGGLPQPTGRSGQ